MEFLVVLEVGFKLLRWEVKVFEGGYSYKGCSVQNVCAMYPGGGGRDL
jgi:hypothetical protein